MTCLHIGPPEAERVTAEPVDAADSKDCGRRQAVRPNRLLVLHFQAHATTQPNCQRCGLCSPVMVCRGWTVTNWSRFARSQRLSSSTIVLTAGKGQNT